MKHHHIENFNALMVDTDPLKSYTLIEFIFSTITVNFWQENLLESDH